MACSGSITRDGNMGASPSSHELVVATLIGLGLPGPVEIIQTMLMKDGYFVGYKFRYNGGYAILPAGGNTIEFYNEEGKLLKTVAVEGDRGAAA
jgi:hypothetical protein